MENQGPQKIDLEKREIDSLALLEHVQTKDNAAFILLKGGERGGLQPELVEEAISLLSRWFEITRGEQHRPTLHNINVRWGNPGLEYQFARMAKNPCFSAEFMEAGRAKVQSGDLSGLREWFLEAEKLDPGDTGLIRQELMIDYLTQPAQTLMLRLKHGVDRRVILRDLDLLNKDNLIKAVGEQRAELDWTTPETADLQEFVKRIVVGRTDSYNAWPGSLRSVVARELRTGKLRPVMEATMSHRTKNETVWRPLPGDFNSENDDEETIASTLVNGIHTLDRTPAEFNLMSQAEAAKFYTALQEPVKKSPEFLAFQQDLFLRNSGGVLDETEIRSLSELDLAMSGQDDAKAALIQALGQEKAEKIWQRYIHFLQKKERRVVESLVANPERSGPLIQYLDWDFVSEKLRNGSKIEFCHQGEVILDREKAEKEARFYVILDGVVRYERLDIEGNVTKSADNKPYEYFGEQILLNGKITDSINRVVSERAILLSIDEKTFEEALERKKDTLKGKLAEVFHTSESVAAEILKYGRLNVCRKNQSINTQGLSQDKLFLILQGSVFILRDSHLVNRLGNGEIVGDIEMFKEGKTNLASVVAEEDTMVFEIRISDLSGIMKQNRSVLLRLAEVAREKELAGGVLESKADPYGIYDFDFSKLDASLIEASPSETLHVERNKILIRRLARETVSMISRLEHNEDFSEESVSALFEMICRNLENQQVDDPKQFVSHGVQHTFNVVNFSQAVVEGSETMRQNLSEKFGQNGQILVCLAAIFHDIGYPLLGPAGNLPKWKHQEFSQKIVEAELPYSELRKILDISDAEYALFLEAIGHHGSDNPAKKAEGRPFVETDNEKNPLLVVMRIADNLDLIQERLSKLQLDQDFMSVMEKFHRVCLKQFIDKECFLDEQQASKLMAEVFEQEKVALLPKMLIPGEEARIGEVLANLEKAVLIGDWQGYLHFKSVAIAQNVFVREELHDGKPRLTIYVEYNQPTNELPLSLINWQTGRLLASAKESFKIVNNNGEDIPIAIKQIFPNPCKNIGAKSD